MDETQEESGSDDSKLYVPIKKRKLERYRALLASAQETEANVPEEEPEAAPPAASGGGVEESLLAHAMKLQEEKAQVPFDPQAEARALEVRLLEAVQRSLSKPLRSVRERARGIVYKQAMKSVSWTLPRKYEQLSEEVRDLLRDKYRIDVTGDDPPPPLMKFKHMKLHKSILRQLNRDGIFEPTAIQMQGIPVVLSGRDMIGIASTGSGKTLVFVIPMILIALEAELKLPLKQSEGPIGLVLCPSRELATQTFETVIKYCDAMAAHSLPRLRVTATIGGVSLREQLGRIREGVHIIVATPGRLNDLMNKKVLNLTQCVYLTLDEADRLVDLGFEDEIRTVFDHFQNQRQTVLFSATMPRKVQEFAESALSSPVIVSVGRAGAANMLVTQDIEYVKAESRLKFLLECLQKTPPPVMIFCENKRDVDDVHEYLLLKGIDAVAIHGGLSQSERTEAVSDFKAGRKDVLIGTDVASKGLDFPGIQHVINYDLPREIENYIHRIGRTGRCGRTGLATTLVSRSQNESVLLDLRALLKESGQRVSPFLDAVAAQSLNSASDANADASGLSGCAFCGGLGHRIAKCPKLQVHRSRQQGGARNSDLLANETRYNGSGAYGGSW